MRVRTTVHLDDDVYRAARSLATSQGRRLGAVLSDLARAGLRPKAAVRVDATGFPIVRVSAGAPLVTPETIRAAIDET
jgi:hypothetical protein